MKYAYADVAQRVPRRSGNNGTVNIRLLPQKDYQEQTLCELVDIIGGLIDKGIAANSIAILVRTNNLIPLVANYFSEHLPDLRIISDEAFRLDASVAVSLLVNALHLLTHPDDQLAKATIGKLYQRSVCGNDISESELLIQDRPLNDLLPEAFTHHMAELLQMPLYELTERLYTIFQLDKLNEQSAYIYYCYFF